jgi:hypothetical protein
MKPSPLQLRDVSSTAAGDVSALEARDMSPEASRDTSPGAGGDTSSTAASDGRRRCGWCRCELRATARLEALYCRQACRQAGFRLRRRRVTDEVHGQPMRFCYADPPYPGKARLYRRERSYGGEVDHAALIERLEGEAFDGWALSTSEAALRDVLPLCPRGARVGVWCKPLPPDVRTRGIHRLWEAVIVVGGRQRPPGVSSWLLAKPARGGGTLIGRKPVAFCAWLFDLLGMQAGDSLEDWFPGTGIVSRAWADLSARTSRDGSRRRWSRGT